MSNKLVTGGVLAVIGLITLKVLGVIPSAPGEQDKLM